MDNILRNLEAETHAGLMDQITVSNLAQTNDTISQLYRTFLARLSFPRLVHFLDLVLPQMLLHQRIREQNQVRHLTSHWLSLLEQERNAFTPLLHLNFLFSSHAGLVHVLIEWYRNPLLVFSDYPKVEQVSLEVLRNATTLDTYRQHVAMGIRSGQSALFAFESDGDLYKMIGILITSNVPPSVAKENRHWKHVAPHQTELAILPPELAETFCREALEGFQNHQNYEYIEDWIGIFSPTEGGRVPVKMHHIELLGETRSADDLGVFCTMPAERLCIGCGLTSHERPTGTHPNQKAALREAAVRLLSVVLLPNPKEEDNEEVLAFKQACQELRQQNDGHFLSMVSSLVLAILTGRTDLCVSGVFGAGKTRAAAALIAGLMVMDPSLNLMVMTKENTAAKAFTDHLLSLQLPQSVYDRAGRIVGYLETKTGASHKTKLDIEQERRNDVLRGKKLLIGCGGGFQQESQQRYSPVRQWISTIHLALMDEAQQYGNIDELTTLARAPNHCLVLWCGEHKQTPGGLRNTTEAKMFRRKLLSRPLGLRCDTEYVQPHLLGKIVAKFMVGTAGSMADRWATFLKGNAQIETLGSQVVDFMAKIPAEQSACFSAALATYFLARRQEELLTPLAVTLNEAAGTAGIHRWNLILPSSARVSILTYQTVIGVRYHELVKLSGGEYPFGRFLSDLSAKKGGFLPILWDAPKSDTYAVQDIGMVVDHLKKIFTFTSRPEETLAVLHNKNRLVHAFSRSGWIQDTLGEILSRSVTSCAGMTAKVTIIAQTRIGFLSGLRRIPHGEEAENSFEVQREEAAVRATVALTRAKELCVVLGPLDMLGLIGAATVVGSLMYGVGICWRQDLELHYQQEEAEGSMDDEKMINMLKGAGPSSDFPPLALAEIAHVSKEEFIAQVVV